MTDIFSNLVAQLEHTAPVEPTHQEEPVTMPKKKESGGIAEAAAAHINQLTEPQTPGVVALALGIETASLLPHLKVLSDSGAISRQDAPPGSGRGVRFVYGPSEAKPKLKPQKSARTATPAPTTNPEPSVHLSPEDSAAPAAAAPENGAAIFAIENTGALGIAVGPSHVKLTLAEVNGLSRFLDTTKPLWSRA